MENIWRWRSVAITSAVVVAAIVLATSYYLAGSRSDEPSAYASATTDLEEVGEQFEARVRQIEQRGEEPTIKHIASFAASHNAQWGIVEAEGGVVLDGNIEDFLAGVVGRAISAQSPNEDVTRIKAGPREGGLIGTYAHPIHVVSAQDTAVVFTKFYD